LATRKTELVVGGLVAAGFNETGEYLLTVSHSGRGVFSTATWERVARDSSDYYPDDEGTALGIGPLSGQVIAVTPINYDTGVLETSSTDRRIQLRYESGTIEVLDSRFDT
jgi:hypothetical protein